MPTCLLLLAAMLFAAPAFGQDEPPPEPPAEQPDTEEQPTPEEPPAEADRIDIDFVRKDIHTVMHYIGLRANLSILVDGEVDVVLTIIHRNANPREAIRSICKANKLDYIEEGTGIIIKARAAVTSLANVVKSEMPGRYNVSFQLHDLVAAINEVADVTQTDAFVPAAPPEELGTPGITPSGEPTEPDAPARPGAGGDVVRIVRQRQISMYMREATPEAIMQRLAVLGGLDVLVKMREDDTEVKRVGFEFRYRPTRISQEIPGSETGDFPLARGEWTLPTIDTDKVKTEVKNLMSARGVAVADKMTGYFVVYDIESPYLERVRDFLDPLSAMITDKASRDSMGDPLEVRVYQTIRDVGDKDLVAQIQTTLSDEGRVIPNPDRNSMIIWERRSRLPLLDELMKSLNTEPDQVMITAQLVEVTLDEYIGYGLEIFNTTPATSLNDGMFTFSGQDSSGGTVGGLYGQPTGFNPFFATFVNPRLDIRLELLANEGKVKTLSKPSTMASNKRPAHIEVGQEIPYLAASSATGGGTTTQVSFKSVSIAMDVTPTVLADGLIRLQVDMVVAEVIGNVAIEGNNTPVLSKRQSKTDVFIRDGETLVMGGLMRERERTDENGLPFLKDIPFLGYLFKSANKSVNKTDLLFFLRPTIVSANGPQHQRSGLDIGRQLHPVIYEDGDEKKADIRPDRFRKLGLTPKPKHYNPANRPKTSADVNPAA